MILRASDSIRSAGMRKVTPVILPSGRRSSLTNPAAWGSFARKSTLAPGAWSLAISAPEVEKATITSTPSSSHSSTASVALAGSG